MTYNTARVLSTIFAAGIILTGCGGNDQSATTAPSTQELRGALVKGPISGATIRVYDAEHNEIATTTSSEGTFVLPSIELQSRYYIIVSDGGTYTDESTQKLVSIPAGEGLQTLLTSDEIQEMLAQQQWMALTPETTLFSILTQKKLLEYNLSESMFQANRVIDDTLIKNSSPMPNVSGDVFTKQGDLTKALPANTNQAFAKNRIVAYSVMMRNLGIEPVRVFEILTKLTDDLKDGMADGIDIDGKEIDIPQEYALARTQLFNETTTKLREGNLSNAQTEALRMMGFDVDMLQADKDKSTDALDAKVATYLKSTTLPMLHRLETLIDEDGNLEDTAATYTLTARHDVNVTIETPTGSWITPMWRYNNQPLPVVIRANRGTDMTLNFNNQLNADSTIHWHGFKIPAIMDGGPDVPVASGQSKAYAFTMQQPAAPLWFHPHPDMQTGKQVYMGLAGVFLLEDTISKELEADNKLPSGTRDIVLLIQDRRFAAESQGVRALEYKTMPMDSDGMLGDTILVNGSVMPKFEVGTVQYRLRLYNVSNARSYDFAFHDHRIFKVVATDGGLLKEPVTVDHITLGAAERAEIVVDFSQDAVGSKVVMVSQPGKGDIMNMMGTMDTSGNNVSGMNRMMDNMGSGNMSTPTGSGMSDAAEGFVLMRFDVTHEVKDEVRLYTTLPSRAEITGRLQENDAVNAGNEREFVMSMVRGGNSAMASDGMNMLFTINGKLFDMNRVDEFIDANTVEIWSIKNMSPMAHPFHAHAIQYQILDRNGVAASGVDLGWKDTFLVQPGETIRIIGKFEPVNQGDYMYHCHILEHEDAGMMGFFRVGATGNVGSR